MAVTGSVGATSLPSSSGRTPTTTAIPSQPVLILGSSGRRVRNLQHRLDKLGYWVGPPNGYFGDSTQQGVFAFQKSAGLKPTGKVAAPTLALLAKGAEPVFRKVKGYVIEVNLTRDLLMIVRKDTLLYTLNTSTGGGYTYCVKGVCSVATTPSGHFQIYRQVDGSVTDALGTLWRPKYFDSGFAIHGDSYVPQVPVSHGCVRISNEAIDWVWATDLAPIGTHVWVFDAKKKTI
jgi:hypothetical protein